MLRSPLLNTVSLLLLPLSPLPTGASSSQCATPYLTDKDASGAATTNSSLFHPTNTRTAYSTVWSSAATSVGGVSCGYGSSHCGATRRQSPIDLASGPGLLYEADLAGAIR